MKYHDISHKIKFFSSNLSETYTVSELFENDITCGQKNKRIKSKNHFNIKMILFFFITLYINIHNINCNSPKITLKTYGTGEQQIINSNYIQHISAININNEDKQDIKNIYDFTEQNNIITLTFENSYNNLDRMFYSCKKIYEIDFTNFDTSKVKDMHEIFRNCESLLSLNLLN